MQAAFIRLIMGQLTDAIIDRYSTYAKVWQSIQDDIRQVRTPPLYY